LEIVMTLDSASGVTWTFWFPIIVSALALIVSALTAWATVHGPKRAAEIAEQLRSASAKVERREGMKLHVFAQIMQERAAPYTLEAVRALNLIDIVYIDADAVREAWKEYIWSLDPANKIAPENARRYLNDLLVAMAGDLGMAGIKASDISRIYSPVYITRRHSVEDMQLTMHEMTLKEAFSKMSANTTPQEVK
jgi:hypothetical protein